MVAKTYARPAPQPRSNPLAALLRIVRRADAYVFPPQFNPGGGFGNGPTSDLRAWAPHLPEGGASSGTHRGLIVPSSVSQPEQMYWR